MLACNSGLQCVNSAPALSKEISLKHDEAGSAVGMRSPAQVVDIVPGRLRGELQEELPLLERGCLLALEFHGQQRLFLEGAPHLRKCISTRRGRTAREVAADPRRFDPVAAPATATLESITNCRESVFQPLGLLKRLLKLKLTVGIRRTR